MTQQHDSPSEDKMRLGRTLSREEMEKALADAIERGDSGYAEILERILARDPDPDVQKMLADRLDPPDDRPEIAIVK